MILSHSPHIPSVTNLNPFSVYGRLTFAMSLNSSAVGDPTAFSASKGLRVWVSYSNVWPKDPMLKVDLNVGMYVKDLVYVGFSGPTQHSIKVHSVEWCMAKEAARSTTITQ